MERFDAAGVRRTTCRSRETLSCSTSPARHPGLSMNSGTTTGPTMNAFEAAEKNGRAGDLKNELDALFESQNTSANKDVTSISATFLRVMVFID